MFFGVQMVLYNTSLKIYITCIIEYYKMIIDVEQLHLKLYYRVSNNK